LTDIQKNKGDINMEEKIKALCDKITAEKKGYLIAHGLGCECNIKTSIAHYKINKKYTNIDVGDSGCYMVVNATGEIFGIKAYGVIHRGHFFGTLDTIDQYFWGDYRAEKKGVINA
jgi:hypothetical protein